MEGSFPKLFNYLVSRNPAARPTDARIPPASGGTRPAPLTTDPDHLNTKRCGHSDTERGGRGGGEGEPGVPARHLPEQRGARRELGDDQARGSPSAPQD